MESKWNARGRLSFYSQVRKSLPIEIYCPICNKIYNKRFIEIEHTIPISLGGKKEEYTLMCIRCHRNKTNVDKLIINFLKRSRVLYRLNLGSYQTYLTFEEIQSTYKMLFDIITRSHIEEQKYDEAKQ